METEHNQNQDPPSEEQQVPGNQESQVASKSKKKKNRKKKGGVSNETTAATEGSVAAPAPPVRGAGHVEPPAAPAIAQEDIMKMIKRLEVAQKKQEAAGPKEHKFWNTQPVLQEELKEEEYGPIEVQTVDDIRKEPYNMPAGFEWCSVDVTNDAEIQEVYTLLTENYVEDDDNMFRFDYSVPFLRWALTPPGFNPDLHIGVRASKSGKLMGFITGIPQRMQVYADAVQMVEINFLCVHKKLRAKRLAPVLIKEVTRRTNLTGVFQAVYTAGVVLPKPVAECRYWHRSLNPKKLIDVGFSRLRPKTTLQRTIKDYRLPAAPGVPGFRAMEPGDVPQVQALLANYLARHTRVYPLLDEAEVGHWLLPTPGVVSSYVVEDPGSPGTLTDVCSFYHLPSSIIGNPEHRTLFAGYSFYNVAGSLEWIDLMRALLIKARDEGMDVFNALDLMQNQTFLQDLKFGIGDGHLQYYLYNWKCPKVEPQGIGLVLL